jgi:Domain of unknown function (DUF4105)
MRQSRRGTPSGAPRLEAAVRVLCQLGLVIGLVSACGHGSLGSPAARYARPSSDSYTEALVRKAQALRLAEHPQWRELLHYRLGLLGAGFMGGGYASQAADSEFFLSPRGNQDPEAELSATLRAFFAPLSAAAAVRLRGSESGTDRHALCRFPARFMFLRQALEIDVARLPVHQCPRAEQFFNELDPSSVTLIFSSYYLNNPASAFGHTFLRINKRNVLAAAERRELLDYAVDYSADVDSDNALIYAFKGIFGMFPGTFKRVPYFYKVRSYNDYEARDLWEYELNLEPAQLAMLVAHLWELGHTYFAYYYLGENCSYQILSLIDVANPQLQLLRDIHSPVIPADTIKALYASPGLVRRSSFRPSLRRQFNTRAERLDDAQRSAVEELAANPERALPQTWSPERRIETLDAAADLVDVLYARELIDKSNSDAAQRKQRILERRAEIWLPSQVLVSEPPLAEAPEHGHGSHRLGLGAASFAGRFAPTLEFRLALHDLADATPGYPELSAIEFMRARLQFWAPGRVELDDASLVRVSSLVPQTRFDRKISWEFDVGASTIRDAACEHCLAPRVAGGGGLAYAFFGRALTAFALLHGVLAWSPTLSGLGPSHTRIGIGPSGGLRLRIVDDLILLAVARWHWLPGQEPARTYQLEATLRMRWADWLALGLEGRRTPDGFGAQLLAFSYF